MHFGIISAPVPGHLIPCCSMCLGLRNRGHKLTVFNIADSEDFVKSFGIDFIPIGINEFPAGSWHKRWNPARTGSNLWRDTRILKAHIEIAEIMLRDLPDILFENDVDVLIVDHLQAQGSSLAEKLGIPFISICSILPLHKDRSGMVPASFAWWQIKNSMFNRFINRLSHKIVDFLSYTYLKKVNHYRKKWELLKLKSLEDSFSSIAQLGVIPHEIDFPRPFIKNYYIVGPAIIQRAKIDFPWEKLDGRPIVYASMGTIRNKIDSIYKIIISTFKKLPEFQLILSKGAWNGGGFEVSAVPENVLLVDFAPQLEILQRASLCISHAGPGTIMESIYYGVPIIAIPVADDQPAMAARIVYHKLGVSIPFRKLSSEKLQKAIKFVMNSREIRDAVEEMSVKIKKYNASEQAPAIILKKLKPEKDSDN